MFDLKKWMDAHGLTIKEMARMADICEQTLSKVRKGKTAKAETLEKICDVIGMPLRESDWPNEIVGALERQHECKKVIPQKVDWVDVVKKGITPGMRLSVNFADPLTRGSGVRCEKRRQVKSTVICKYENYALLELALGNARIKKCYTYDVLAKCKELKGRIV